ncbi:hypothetical protein RJ640_009420 [Escallonia rubra]|uniref:Uncharacterized protein n=1 Tax=Escallonia rubra TaxID=112253 RepID=A0AA88QHK9_9ASTE|nr:hypothetical protein RJ640_009420 [Escallonia rubra]
MDTACPSRFGTTIHVTALDGIVNVNSLFTLAVFVGLAWKPTDPTNSLVDDPKCQAGSSIAEDLIAFHVYSFSCFLFSSLVALGLKQAIRIARNSTEAHRTLFTLDLCHINRTALRFGYLVSAAGSVCGCGFLMMALVNVVQIKLGTLACGSSHTYGAVIPLVILVPVALLIYVCSVLYAFTHSCTYATRKFRWDGTHMDGVYFLSWEVGSYWEQQSKVYPDFSDGFDLVEHDIWWTLSTLKCRSMTGIGRGAPSLQFSSDHASHLDHIKKEAAAGTIVTGFGQVEWLQRATELLKLLSGMEIMATTSASSASVFEEIILLKCAH